MIYKKIINTILLKMINIYSFKYRNKLYNSSNDYDLREKLLYILII
jgi:hypothetical protein